MMVGINLSARGLLLLSVIRRVEYGSEVWEVNKVLANASETVVLGGAKGILGCSSKPVTRQLEGHWLRNTEVSNNA